MIDVTGVDLTKFAQKAYDLSIPQGLGYLQFKPGGLSDIDVLECLGKPDARVALDMDYVHGRACKMIVFREDGKLIIADAWYDHTDSQLAALLKEFNITAPSPFEHGMSCECRDCKATSRR
jgi:hypothetical protein